MYMGVILNMLLHYIGGLRIPHVYGGDPIPLSKSSGPRVVFPMYMGVIPG